MFYSQPDEKTNKVETKTKFLSSVPSKPKEDEIKKEKAKKSQQNSGDSDSGDEQMMQALGFASFDSSKGKDHTKDAAESVFKSSKARRRYRQYMNRPGGFDRNLDKFY